MSRDLDNGAANRSYVAEGLSVFCLVRIIITVAYYPCDPVCRIYNDLAGLRNAAGALDVSGGLCMFMSIYHVHGICSPGS